MWWFWPSIVAAVFAAIFIGGYILVLRERVAKACWVIEFLRHNQRRTSDLRKTPMSLDVAMYIWLYRAGEKGWIDSCIIGDGRRLYWLTLEGKANIYKLVRL